MNTIVQCLVLLTFIAICTSRTIIRCRCITTTAAVNRSRIVEINEYGPRSYCNRREVLVKLRNKKNPVCLDPDSVFTQTILSESKQKEMNSTPETQKNTPATTVASTTASLPQESTTKQ